jgi:hypothetical protein
VLDVKAELGVVIDERTEIALVFFGSKMREQLIEKIIENRFDTRPLRLPAESELGRVLP